MVEHPVRKLLLRIIWASNNRSNFELAYLHRGAPGDTMTINASEIERVGKGWFRLSDGETQIPFHRILYIRDRKKRVTLWEKRGRDS